MSTYWYFECNSHTPALRSDDDFTQHTEDAAWKRALELARSRPLPMDSDGNDFVRPGVVWFLNAHPNCELSVVSEYGERRSGNYLLGPRS